MATSTSSPATISSASPSFSSSCHSSTLSAGAKAGVAVGCVVGGLTLLAVGAVVLMRRFKYQPMFRGRYEVDTVKMRRLDDKSPFAERI